MKIHFTKLERNSIVNDGTWGTFYYNKEKYSGVVYDTYGDLIYWIFEVKDGLQSGIEKTYYEGTKIIEQIVEYKDNFQFGVSKEFDEEGNLKIVNIVYNNDELKSIEVEDNLLKEVQTYDGKYGERLPEYLQNLLKLSNEQLFKYEFKMSPSLIID